MAVRALIEQRFACAAIECEHHPGTGRAGTGRLGRDTRPAPPFPRAGIAPKTRNHPPVDEPTRMRPPYPTPTISPAFSRP